MTSEAKVAALRIRMDKAAMLAVELMKAHPELLGPLHDLVGHLAVIGNYVGELTDPDVLDTPEIPSTWNALTDGEGDRWIRRGPGQKTWRTDDSGPALRCPEIHLIEQYGPVRRAT